ncbi:halocyanin domain-containing protein [Halovenus halobia]|uniref:halocyanin domain-containing protein n=1 Tax=Halovenus halobia TaxID=3396622 RepID=UPI003F5796BF
MSRIDRDRRKFLAAGSTAAAISLAGCSSVLLNRIGGDGDGGEDGGDDGGGGGGGGGGGTNRGENVPEAVHSYLTDNSAKLYEGQANDQTGNSEVTISVGAGDGFAFDHPAVLVDAGTTIVWEWVGGQHNVVSADSSATEFRSGDPAQGSDITFPQTFEESGNQLYYCSPHTAVGMYGAVIVE